MMHAAVVVFPGSNCDRDLAVAFEAAAREAGFVGFGFYPRTGFIHVDLGPARQSEVRTRNRRSSFGRRALRP